MWIAKPVCALSSEEKRDWVSLCTERRARGEDIPFSQSLVWAEGIRSLEKEPFLVFSPDEKAGGIVFGAPDFECVNGPLLDWADAGTAPRQLATFATAVSKLRPGFRSLTLSPRWKKGSAQAILPHLPIESDEVSSVATIQIPVQADPALQGELLQPRFRRTLRHAIGAQTAVQSTEANSEVLRSWHPRMREFATRKGLSCPPLGWFLSLVQAGVAREEQISFRLFSAEVNDRGLSARAEVLVALRGRDAFYLFGNETRATGIPSRLSSAALAHWQALQFCGTAGIRHYDLNGYVVDARQNHPYAGVCRFKEQFGGTVVEYEIPRFCIQ